MSMNEAGSFERAPDPGSPLMAKIAAIAAVVMIGVVVYLNQAEHKLSMVKAPAAASAPELDEFTILAKAMVKMAHMINDPNQRGTVVRSLDDKTQKDEDRLHAAIVAGDLTGGDAALQRLGAIHTTDPALSEEQLLLTSIYEGHGLSDSERAKLIEREGWFGKLAASFGKPDTDPEREALVGGGGRLIVLTVCIGTVLLVGGLGSLACCITMIILLATGRLKRRFVPPVPGGSVFLEVVPVFVFGFILLRLVSSLAVSAMAGGAAHPPAWAKAMVLGSQWLMVLLLFYPLLRGCSWRQLREGLGWTRGRGFFVEAGCGIFAHLASIPLVIGAAIVSLVLVKMREHLVGGGPPKNPILDIVSGGDTLTLVFLYLLATMWAPIVEEAVFRGAFFRHMRGIVGPGVAALTTAVGFGLMHGYDLLELLPVMTLGFVFAWMREWRGTLIPSMVAHCVNNAVVLGMVLMAVWALGD
jgi:membrane protease YdiL (CAAX protease family)